MTQEADPPNPDAIDAGAPPETPNTTPPGDSRRRWFLGGGALVIVSAAVVGVVLWLGGRSAGDPTALADLAPANANLFVGFNTDLTSGPWRSAGELTQVLLGTDRYRTERDKQLHDWGLDYGKDVAPALGSITGAAFIATAPDDVRGLLQGNFDDGIAVMVVRSREPQGLRDLLVRLYESSDRQTTRKESHDATLGVDFVTLEGNGTTVVGIRKDLVYIADSTRDVTGLLQDRESLGPITRSPQFNAFAKEAGGDALTFGYFDLGPVLKAMIEQNPEMRLALASLNGDYSRSSGAFTLGAHKDGFSGEFISRVYEADQHAIPAALRDPASIDDTARLAPANTAFFLTGNNLQSVLAPALKDLRALPGGYGEVLDDVLAGLEDATGVRLERDIVDRLTGAYALAVGIDNGKRQTASSVVFAAQPDRTADFQRSTERARRGFEDACRCKSNVQVETKGSFVVTTWSRSGQGISGSLSDNENFKVTRRRLPERSSMLMFADFQPLWQTFDSASPSSADFNAQAIRGFGLATTVDGRIIKVHAVVPIDRSKAKR